MHACMHAVAASVRHLMSSESVALLTPLSSLAQRHHGDCITVLQVVSLFARARIRWPGEVAFTALTTASRHLSCALMFCSCAFLGRRCHLRLLAQTHRGIAAALRGFLRCCSADELKYLLNILSVFNLNIEIVAPEWCVIVGETG